MALPTIDIGRLIEDANIFLASLGGMANATDTEMFDFCWSNLRGALRRLNERLNQGDVQLLDCSIYDRGCLEQLWLALDQWNGFSKPEFTAEAQEELKRFSLGARLLIGAMPLRGLQQNAQADSKSSPIALTPLQAAIWKALDKRALKKQPLADEVCGSDGGRLYKPGGIKELIAAGKVQHKNGVGYFRPDAPPS